VFLGIRILLAPAQTHLSRFLQLSTKQGAFQYDIPTVKRLISDCFHES
jgi:hypothetical protein